MFAWILKTKPENVRDRRARSCPSSVARVPRRRRELDELVEERLDAEVGHGAAEEDGRELPGEEASRGRSLARALEQRELLPQLAVALLAQRARTLGIVERARRHGRPALAALGALEPQHLAPLAIVDAEEAGPGAHRPVDGAAGDAEHRSISSSSSSGGRPDAVQLVDEGDDRDAAHAADLEELDRLRLDALDAVDEHDGRVGRRERAVGVLAEVVVAGRVEQVHAAARVLELQHAGGDGDAALALDLHPVAGGLARAPLGPLDRAGEVDRRRRRAAVSRSASSCPRRGAR